MRASDFIINIGTGILVRNDYKMSDKSPNYVGEIVTPDGGKYRVAGWVQKVESGEQYLSLKIEDEPPQFPTK